MSIGASVLAVILVVEVALAAYCIVTRSNQTRARSFVRIGTLAGLVVLTLLSVLEWGLRWYLLGLVLIVWSALAGWTLIRWKAETKKYDAVRIVLKAIGALTLFAIAVVPALVFPQYRLPQPTGSYAVATANYTYTDESRVETFANTGENRKVNVEFWYPKDGADKYPLVVYSHGAFGTKGDNTSTFTDLASNGYVVCSIDHPYHALFTSGSEGKAVLIDRGYLQEFQDTNAGVYDDPTTVGLYQKWMKLRTEDVGFVLDTIVGNAESAGADKVYQLVDTGRIGLFGHSMGGAAMAQVGRERHDVDAVVNLDTDLLGDYLGYANGEPVITDAIYPIPILSIFSDDMTQLFARVTDPNQVIAWKRVMATAPKAYEVHIAGTNHMNLTDIPLTMPIIVTLFGDPKGLGNGKNVDPYQMIESTNANVLRFFDSYLKGKGSFAPAGTH